MRYSGHESFACRYAWLPKACHAIAENRGALYDEEWAMAELGVGKNMVRSIRFWVEVMGIAVSYGGREAARGPARTATTERGVSRARAGCVNAVRDDGDAAESAGTVPAGTDARADERGHELTLFADAVLRPGGHDPYLEDQRTLWLLHWNVATYADDPVFAWRYLLNHWPAADFTRTEALDAFVRESARTGSGHSVVTLAQHLDVFLHTYVGSRASAPVRAGASPAEDSLDGPLVELDLLQHVGERRMGLGGRREPVYAFRREPKPEIGPALFAYCVGEYWKQWRPEERTLTFRDIAVAEGGVGQVFKLPEDDVRERLDAWAGPRVDGPFSYQPSAVQGLVARRGADAFPDQRAALARVYDEAAHHG